MANLADYFLSGPTWIVAGLILMALEFVVPGAVIIFFGAGAVLTGVLVIVDVLPGLSAQLITWALSSLILILVFRRKIAQLFPSLERYDPRPEAEEMIGRTVTVLEDILPDSAGERVRFPGATWQAATNATPIYAGQDAKIIGRKNLLLIVAPAHALSEPGAVGTTNPGDTSGLEDGPYV